VAVEGLPGGARFAWKDGLLRVLVAPSLDGEGRAAGDVPGPAGAARIALVLDGGSEPATLDLRRLDLSDGNGTVRSFRAGRDGVVPVRSGSLAALLPNRPNPFNPTTEIAYYLPRAGSVRLRILDTAGRVVAVLAEGPEVAGWHAAIWDGRAAGGEDVGSGVYFASLESEGALRTVRMTLVR
jgi:hypothetical protein